MPSFLMGFTLEKITISPISIYTSMDRISIKDVSEVEATRKLKIRWALLKTFQDVGVKGREF